MRDEPARNGTSARTKPTNLPKKTDLPPWRSKKNIDPVKPRHADPDPAAIAQQPGPPQESAELVPNTVPEGGDESDDQNQVTDIEQSLRREESRDQNQTFAGNEHAQEGC